MMHKVYIILLRVGKFGTTLLMLRERWDKGFFGQFQIVERLGF
jgi:hypothetical protein